MQLELLLPDDYFEIEQRIANLAHWCQGFLQGFALAGHDYQKVRGVQEWPEDINELINDLVKISKNRKRKVKPRNYSCLKGRNMCGLQC